MDQQRTKTADYELMSWFSIFTSKFTLFILQSDQDVSSLFFKSIQKFSLFIANFILANPNNSNPYAKSKREGNLFFRAKYNGNSLMRSFERLNRIICYFCIFTKNLCIYVYMKNRRRTVRRSIADDETSRTILQYWKIVKTYVFVFLSLF
jgi:hypothetical protein